MRRHRALNWVIGGLATSLLLSIAGGLLGSASALPAGKARDSVVEEPPGDAGFVSVSEAEARELDIRDEAERKDWTIEATRLRYAAIEMAIEINGQIALHPPDQLVGFSVSVSDPLAPPELFLKGDADEFVEGLVAKSPVPIELVDDQPYSLIELEQRAALAAESLRFMGFANGSTSFRLGGGGTIQASVQTPVGVHVDLETIRRGMPREIRGNIDLRFGPGAVDVPHLAHGGMKMTAAGSTEGCTSGFAVRKVGATTKGVASAGHCSTKSTIHDPTNGTHPLTFIKEHRGNYGDVEWYSVASTYVRDDFIANFYNNAY